MLKEIVLYRTCKMLFVYFARHTILSDDAM